MLEQTTAQNRRSPDDNQLRQLKHDWPHLNFVERGDRISKILDTGCSQRRLARFLGISPGIIRRNGRIASLSAPARIAIAAGESPQRYLALARSADLAAERVRRLQIQAEEQQRRLQIEAGSAKLSDQLADLIFVWLETVDLAALYFSSLFEEARRKIRFKDFWSRQFPALLLGPAAPGASAWDVIKGAQPNEDDCGIDVDFYATWLAIWILRLAPEAVIRDAALSKAERRLSR